MNNNYKLTYSSNTNEATGPSERQGQAFLHFRPQTESKKHCIVDSSSVIAWKNLFYQVRSNGNLYH